MKITTLLFGFFIFISCNDEGNPEFNKNLKLDFRDPPGSNQKCILKFKIISDTYTNSPDHYITEFVTLNDCNPSPPPNCYFFRTFLFDSGSSGCSHGNNSSCEIDNPTLNSFYDANCELNPYFSYIRVIYHPNEITTGCTLNSTPGTIEYELSSSPKYTTGDCPYPISSVIGGTLSNGSASIVYKDYELYGNCGCQIREK